MKELNFELILPNADILKIRILSSMGMTTAFVVTDAGEMHLDYFRQDIQSMIWKKAFEVYARANSFQ